MKPSISLILQALADETRRSLLLQVVDEAKPVGELVPPQSISAPAVSRHLRVLERAGLISRKRNGRQLLISLNHESLAEARAFLDEFGKSGSAVAHSLVSSVSKTPTKKTVERFEGIEDLDDDEMASLL